MIYSLALILLLGFELSYYLLIVQTGVVAHYNSDLIKLFPMFAGGVLGTLLGGVSWGKINNPIDKIMLALSLQLLLSLSYPNYNIVTLSLLGVAVGLMAPLGIYLFKAKQRKELLFALAIAYTIGTYSFTSVVDDRLWMAITFTLIAFGSALVLRGYVVDRDSKVVSRSLISYSPLMLWLLLDSNLFETLSRSGALDIWSHKTALIIAFHLFGLVAAYFIHISRVKQHIFIGLQFIGSYTLLYLEWTLALAMLYPFTISYYNVIVFTALSQETSIFKLSFTMIFVGWIASGLGLAIAVSKILY